MISPKSRNVLLALTSALIAFILLVSLFLALDISLDNTLNQISAVFHPAFLFLILLTFLIMYLSQERWQILQMHYTPSNPLKRHSTLLYTCLGTTLSQFIPQHISTGLARSAGSWLEKKSHPAHSIAFTIIEQMMDLLLSLTILASSLLFLLGYIHFLSWVAMAAASLIALIFPLYLVTTKAPNIGRAITNISPLFNKLIPKKFFGAISSLELPPWKVVFKLYKFSALKFISLLARAIIIGWLSLPEFNWWELGPTIPIMQLSGILPITPGSLGITEWAWSSVIILLGIPLSIAAQFTLTHRVTTFLTQLIVTFGATIIYFVFRRRHQI